MLVSPWARRREDADKSLVRIVPYGQCSHSVLFEVRKRCEGCGGEQWILCSAYTRHVGRKDLCRSCCQKGRSQSERSKELRREWHRQHGHSPEFKTKMAEGKIRARPELVRWDWITKEWLEEQLKTKTFRQISTEIRGPLSNPHCGNYLSNPHCGNYLRTVARRLGVLRGPMVVTEDVAGPALANLSDGIVAHPSGGPYPPSIPVDTIAKTGTITKGRRFDHDECERLYRDGMSSVELARRYGVRPQSISHVLSRRGVPIRDWRMKGQRRHKPYRYGPGAKERMCQNGLRSMEKPYGRYRVYRYENLILRSSYEVRVACWLDQERIDWTYESMRIKLSSGAYWVPDFQLQDGRIIEVKGHATESFRRKWSCFRTEYPALASRTEIWYKDQVFRLPLSAATELKYRELVNRSESTEAI